MKKGNFYDKNLLGFILLNKNLKFCFTVYFSLDSLYKYKPKLYVEEKLL